MVLHRFYRTPGISSFKKSQLLQKWKDSVGLIDFSSEICFYVEIEHGVDLTPSQWDIIVWLLSETFEPNLFGKQSFLSTETKDVVRLLEVGPRMNFTTAYSTNAVSICHSAGLNAVKRIEKSRRLLLHFSGSIKEDVFQLFVDDIHDKMTECVYPTPLNDFETGVQPAPCRTINVMEKGRAALELVNKEMGLAWDDTDLDLYTHLFRDELKRDPTDVECFDLAQSNSEHSRHWFFTGKLVIDGNEIPQSLMSIVKNTLKQNPNNSVLAFCDNSSAIKGHEVNVFYPSNPTEPSKFVNGPRIQHVLFTAETHNFPSGVAPFAGAETGTGGRIRDTHATGRGSLVGGATVGYCVGALNIDDYDLPWEDKTNNYSNTLAHPLKILIDASNGASDYGNKFGEPVIQGFTRSFSMRINNERREWIKPIMFSGGVGFLDDRHLKKYDPELGMAVVKIGGPAYRIGMGGGAASSMIGGSNEANLDFSAVQRGDAEMGQKLNRVIRACVELEMLKKGGNPIISVHDQGAGGSGNVLKEIVNPNGAVIDVEKFILGDKTLSVKEIWGAEYQEQDALLIRQNDFNVLEKIGKREKLPIANVGTITDTGRIVLEVKNEEKNPVDLPLEKVLGKMPPKTFHLNRKPYQLQKLVFPKSRIPPLSVTLPLVFKLVSVGSKRFLTNKVDRSVTGLISQQQCVGPLHTPISNVAVLSHNYDYLAKKLGESTLKGAAISIGEQPIKGLVDSKAMGSLTVGEMLTNLMWAKISSLSDIKCSGNWMWPAKGKGMDGEGAKMYDAACSMHDAMLQLKIAIDGGKDSLTMAAFVPGRNNQQGEMVKSPGNLVVSGYVECTDITKTVTPDLKLGSLSNKQDGVLIFVDIANGKNRIGGSALAHVFNQIGDEVPDANIDLLKNTFNTIQELIDLRLVSAGHDRSDGGLITTIVEMSLAGNRGIQIKIDKNICEHEDDITNFFYSEELGAVIEIEAKNMATVQKMLSDSNIPHHIIGISTGGSDIKIFYESTELFNFPIVEVRKWWEETSYRIELLQANPDCVNQEREGMIKNGDGFGKGPKYHLNFYPLPCKHVFKKFEVAIIREEGSNGDREMAKAFDEAGFITWDITMTDLLKNNVTLDRFRGIAFVGGFSYADVLGSAKGWASAIKFNAPLNSQFNKFYSRPDTFSLGICNGCQLMALLGIPQFNVEQNDPKSQPRFLQNTSGRFESRWSTVKIESSPSIFFKGMENSILGVWSAHGEGRAFFPDEKILQQVLNENLVPVKYVDYDSNPTESYPYNPSGSKFGIASLCSRDGRHLAIMPHPERSFLLWQWPYVSPEIQDKLLTGGLSPWIKMFQNAREFCERDS